MLSFLQTIPGHNVIPKKHIFVKMQIIHGLFNVYQYILHTFAPGCISMFWSLQITGFCHPWDLLQWILNIWSVKNFPNTKSLTFGFFCNMSGWQSSMDKSSLKKYTHHQNYVSLQKILHYHLNDEKYFWEGKRPWCPNFSKYCPNFSHNFRVIFSTLFSGLNFWFLK